MNKNCKNYQAKSYLIPGKNWYLIEQKSFYIEQISFFYWAKIHFLSSNQFAPEVIYNNVWRYLIFYISMLMHILSYFSPFCNGWKMLFWVKKKLLRLFYLLLVIFFLYLNQINLKSWVVFLSILLLTFVLSEKSFNSKKAMFKSVNKNCR